MRNRVIKRGSRPAARRNSFKRKLETESIFVNVTDTFSLIGSSFFGFKEETEKLRELIQRLVESCKEAIES